mgnify:CR=1 FL=1
MRKSERLVVPPGFEPGSEEPESSMMDRYTKGLYTSQINGLLEIDGSVNLKLLQSDTSTWKPMKSS